MMVSVTNTATLISFIDRKSQTIFCWQEWTTGSNLLVAWCEDRLELKYTNSEPISSETLKITPV
ncbi:hypothetical protein GN244_ATG07909 [Phytophthora infestans]|uniref:Uncharacterized protein n=1 Tax=Phytophthora infestans TaxID=4787 RepID=A0A833WF74_PHYIN|nr:hypothetical protein GN244_ATG07909 [Phytophthora infestans]